MTEEILEEKHLREGQVKHLRAQQILILLDSCRNGTSFVLHLNIIQGREHRKILILLDSCRKGTSFDLHLNIIQGREHRKILILLDSCRKGTSFDLHLNIIQGREHRKILILLDSCRKGLHSSYTQTLLGGELRLGTSLGGGICSLQWRDPALIKAIRGNSITTHRDTYTGERAIHLSSHALRELFI